MIVRRHTGLLGTVAAGLLVSVAALPAGAASAPAGVVTDTADCTAARAAQEAYRVEVIVPDGEQAAARLAELEAAIEAEEADLDVAEDALVAAQGDLAAAEDAVTEAEEALAAAESGTDPDVVAAARQALADAETAREAAEGEVQAAQESVTEVSLGLQSLRIELVETVALSTLLTDLAAGRGFETEAQVETYLRDLRSLDDLPAVVAYADLVETLADECFVYLDEDDEDDDEDTDDGDVAPVAPAAKPVTGRASFTG